MPRDRYPEIELLVRQLRSYRFASEYSQSRREGVDIFVKEHVLTRSLIRSLAHTVACLNELAGEMRVAAMEVNDLFGSGH